MRKERKRNRLEGFDYSQDALYFVTNCVKHNCCCLGEIRNGIMGLNHYGTIAQQQIFWLQERYLYVRIHSAVVMPNHIHAVIEINRDFLPSARMGRDLPPSVRTGRDLSVQKEKAMPKIKSLSELMGAYKTTSSKKIRKAGLTTFAWHRSFYDHIIRTNKAYFNIMQYISENPTRWKQDRFF